MSSLFSIFLINNGVINKKGINMKFSKGKWLFPVVLSVALLTGGCALTHGMFGNASSKIAKQADRIDAVQTQLDNNKDKKILEAKDFSFGTATALNQATNKEPAITVAKEMNDRVENILGLPDLQQQKEMVSLVNGLISNTIAAKVALYQKDNDIIAIQKEEKFLSASKDKEIQKALDLSEKIGLQADASKAELNKYQGWFGLSAIWMGLKQFISSAFWAVLGFGILFLILRVLSTVNPVASAIFSIVDVFFAWVVNAIKVIAPKALTVAKTVSSDVYNGTRSALTSIVDSVETVKMQADASGQPATIEDLLNTAELSMTPEDKAVIEQIKIKLKWVKPSTVTTVAAPVIPTSNVNLEPIVVAPITPTSPNTVASSTVIPTPVPTVPATVTTVTVTK